jgi:hypothetical protein
VFYEFPLEKIARIFSEKILRYFQKENKMNNDFKGIEW